MKRSTQLLLADLNETLAKLRQLNAEAEAFQPILLTSVHQMRQDDENSRRAARLDRIIVEIGKANTHASQLRRDYSLAMADEQKPPPAAPAKSMAEIKKLQKQIAEAEATIADLAEHRRPHVVAAARGSKTAIAALDQIAAVEYTATNRIEIARAAIAEIEMQAGEELQEFQERSADAAFAAAQSAAEDVSNHDHTTDIMMRALAQHLAQRPALLRAIRKTGCPLDDPRMNTLSTVEILHRAAKAAGLAPLLGISVRDAVPLEDASRTLLKLAIRRPEVKGTKAA
jgi:hypothetical protein